jgi:single-strand DNA-binding protein
MASLNRVLLIGNLTRSPELRHTADGLAVADMRLAVNRQYTSPVGEKRSEVTFLTIVVWGKQAEASAQHLGKGSQVFVEGRIQIREWKGKDGQKRTATEVVAEIVQFLNRPKAQEPPQSGSGDEVPF